MLFKKYLFFLGDGRKYVSINERERIKFLERKVCTEYSKILIAYMNTGKIKNDNSFFEVMLTRLSYYFVLDVSLKHLISNLNHSLKKK